MGNKRRCIVYAISSMRFFISSTNNNHRRLVYMFQVLTIVLTVRPIHNYRSIVVVVSRARRAEPEIGGKIRFRHFERSIECRKFDPPRRVEPALRLDDDRARKKRIGRGSLSIRQLYFPYPFLPFLRLSGFFIFLKNFVHKTTTTTTTSQLE